MTDFMAYMAYRFSIRKEVWVAHEPEMDMAVPENRRSFDHMSYSSQYYFVLTVHTMGMILCIISGHGILKDGWNFFNDPITALIVAVPLPAVFFFIVLTYGVLMC